MSINCCISFSSTISSGFKEVRQIVNGHSRLHNLTTRKCANLDDFFQAFGLQLRGSGLFSAFLLLRNEVDIFLMELSSYLL
jgi:hypothetical protein